MPESNERFEEPRSERTPFEHEGAAADGQGQQLNLVHIAQENARTLSSEVSEANKGNAAANEHILQDVHDMKNAGMLKEMAKDLEQSGDAKVTYGADGQVEHIVFAGKDGSAPLDIDVKNDTVNGKSAAQLREASSTQAKEYFAAAFADPKLTDQNGKALSPEAQKEANQLIGALMDGNVDAMTRAAQEIMKNPEMAKSIQSVLERVSATSPIAFGTDANGKPYMQTTTGDMTTVVVPASGKATATDTDLYGKPDYSKSRDLDAAMKAASKMALYMGSEAVSSAEGYLEMAERLPKDGYTNMKSLEHEYTAPTDGDASIMFGKLQRDIAKLTPQEKEIFLKSLEGDNN